MDIYGHYLRIYFLIKAGQLGDVMMTTTPTDIPQAAVRAMAAHDATANQPPASRKDVQVRVLGLVGG